LNKKFNIIQLSLLVLIVLSLAGCSKEQPAAQQKVVVYTSLDKVFSQPILEEFERKTDIKVKAVYDSEATKTTGLVNRLIAEKDSPRADVFWNSETGRTIVLKQKGVLTPYESPSAADIPATFKDAQGFWSGFGARCRINPTPKLRAEAIFYSCPFRTLQVTKIQLSRRLI
jgi:iron(III) transport system substrate-binding protein